MAVGDANAGGFSPPLRAPEGLSAGGPAPPGVSPSVCPGVRLARMVGAYDPRADQGLIAAAYTLAEAAHAPQKRENGEPYIVHPLAVAEILAGYKLDQNSIITALLHDVVEDTPTGLAEIERKFGKEVAKLVDGVTKLTRLELQSERTKQAENFRKLVLAMSEDIRVLLVKLADRLHNMRTLNAVSKPEKRRSTARETLEIYAPLAERIGMDALKTEIETLAFREMDADAWATIAARLSISLRCFKEILSRDEPSRLAWEQGRAAVEQALFDVLFKAAKKGAVVPALFLTKTQFGWREGDVVDQRANILVVMPGAATPEQYAKVIDALPPPAPMQLPAPEPEPKTKLPRATVTRVMR